MLKSGLCDCSDAYILLCGTTTITGGPNDVAEANKRTDERNKEVIFKNCTPFIECTSKINNIQMNHTKALDLAMLMYNLIEYSDSYSKTFGSPWHYYRDQPVLDNTGSFTNFFW